ncbi:MAG: hypothetical protein LBE13_05885 [Bacteroidales bacterium]|jgi:hypothetical protein|nr:hypothetical protein [Bacteroidales bacterium]
MKKLILIAIALLLCSVSSFAQNNDSKPKKTITCKPKKTFSRTTLPPRGGRLKMPDGIEGHKINFGFSLGGSLALIDALNKEKAFIGGRGTVFIHAIIPRTKTFAVGFEGGLTYLLANSTKYRETLIASTRDGALATSKEAQVTVGNWMLPTAQVSFVGNFHPIQRFNVQIKGNIGIVLAMVPKYNGEYYVKEIQSDGTYVENRYAFLYGNDSKIGFSATVGTKLLYALTNHVELGVGLDWSYFRFSYERGWTSPEIKITPELTQFGIFDLHLGLAFSF